ncbi:MAG: VWA domain-containing protein [Pirellulaceae bacterium]
MFQALSSVFANTLTWWQWLIVAAVPPAIIALYFLKLKRVPIEVPSTFLWHRTIEDLHVNSIWQRLRQSLLLLLQLLLLLLIIIALLRPGWQGAQLTGDRFIFLIDTSASMSAKDLSPSRFEDARRRIGEMIDQMKTGDVAMLISFSDVARVEQSFTDSRNLLRGKLQQIRPTNRTSNIQEALRAAAGLANPGRTSEGTGDVPVADAMPATLYIFSDGGFGAVANFDWGNLDPRYIKLGQEDVGNVGVVAFTTERNLEKPGQTQAFARLENFGAEDVTVEAALFHNDRLRDVKNVDVPANGSAGVEYELTDLGGEGGLVDEGVLRLEVSTDDPLAVDDVAYAAMNPPRQARVLLVTPDNEAIKLALGTDEAIKLANVQIAQPALLETKAYDEQAASGAYDLVIYDRCRPKRMPQANTLMFGVVPPGDDWKAGELQGPPLIIDSDRVHPLMQFLEVGNLRIIEGFSIDRPPGSTVLVDSDIGPLVVIGPREGFEDVVVGFEIFSRDGVNTDWPKNRSFPVFMMNALKYLGGIRSSLATQSYKPGQAVVLRSTAPVPTVTVTAPSGRRTVLPRESENTFVYVDAEQPGIYAVQEGSQSKISRHFAVNLFDVPESNILPRAIEMEHETIEGTSAWEPARIDLWKWILIGGLGLLLFEWWVFNRRVYL